MEEELEHQSKELTCVTFSPDGKFLASAGMGDHDIQIWDTGSFDLLPWIAELIKHVVGLDGDVEIGVADLAFSADSQLLAIANADVVKVWDVSRRGEVKVLAGHVGGVLAVAFHPDGQTLASASKDGRIRIWDLQKQRPIKTLPWHQGIRSLMFAPQGKTLLSFGADQVKVWNLSSDWEFNTRNHHTDAAYCVAISPDGKLLASGGGRWRLGPAEVRVLDIETGESLLALDLSFEGDRNTRVFDVAFSPDSKKIVAVGEAAIAKAWRISDGKLLIDLPPGEVGSVRLSGAAFSHDGKYLALGGIRPQLRDAETGELVQHLGSTRAYCVGFGADDRIVYLCGRHFTAWDIQNNKQLYHVELPVGAWRLAHSGDGHLLALALDGRNLPEAKRHQLIQIRAAADGRLIRTINYRGSTVDGYNNSVYGLAFSADGRRIAAGGGDKAVRVFDVATGEELLAFTHAQPVFSVAFGPNGRWLASGSGHWCGPRPGEVRTWEAWTTDRVEGIDNTLPMSPAVRAR